MNIARILKYLKLRAEREWQKVPNEKWKLSIASALPFWIGSFLVGVTAVLYSKLFGFSEEVYFFLLNKLSYWMYPISAILFVGSWWIVKQFAPKAGGSGIPQVSAALELIHSKQTTLLNQLLSLPVALIKIASSCIFTMGGGIIGREGPTIQISASIFAWIYKILPEKWPKISLKNMIMTGAAAGLAAAFNTPLGGLVFAIEELTKQHISNFKNSVFIGVVIAGITAQRYAGSYLYIGTPQLQDASTWMFFLVIITSLFVGFTAGFYTKFAIRLREKIKQLSTTKTIIYLVLLSALITTAGLFLSQSIPGAGKELIVQYLFSNNKSEYWYQPFGKFLGSLFSFTAGPAGGVFAPSLSIGASMSAWLSEILNIQGDNANILILTGMVAFLTGITRSPFTSAILVMEMTDAHGVIFSLMLAGLMANIASKTVQRKSLYEALKSLTLTQ